MPKTRAVPPVVAVPVLKIVAPLLKAPLCIRFSAEQRRRLRRAAEQISGERGVRVDESTLARELVMRGVSKLLD